MQRRFVVQHRCKLMQLRVAKPLRLDDAHKAPADERVVVDDQHRECSRHGAYDND